ncbi:PREDICTED: LOW QUALITY PROTEIN: probable DNA-3-methyladenine glycosylase [Branchiostoma belcheri]|uniref:DNA-3-methyladenine glycosylase n=1 Tax=Branchiostoma belcheri TaxID=7741 RepID=A0A6P4YF39_BRABE|nr:PREDICTED: LOW QUALITY PROTEIN: probable DNA-3-methyladenine glycosylase [Branchiostoma belcheri]
MSDLPFRVGGQTGAAGKEATRRYCCPDKPDLPLIAEFDSIRSGVNFRRRKCNVVQVGKDLLGGVPEHVWAVRKLDNDSVVSGMIVETEAYCGRDDKASHSFGNKKTERNAAMFMKPGTAYVYIIYGMYHCFNISSQGEGAAVLIRAVQPLTGVDRMKVQRGQRRGDKGADLKTEQLGNGPSKLCQALHIDKDTVNQEDLTTCPFIWLEPGEDVKDSDIIHSTRIGIDSSGEEWAKKPWRFYVKGNRSVSIRDKKAEKETEKL